MADRITLEDLEQLWRSSPGAYRQAAAMARDYPGEPDIAREYIKIMLSQEYLSRPAADSRIIRSSRSSLSNSTRILKLTPQWQELWNALWLYRREGITMTTPVIAHLNRRWRHSALQLLVSHGYVHAGWERPAGGGKRAYTYALTDLATPEFPQIELSNDVRIKS
jgi:hypothetical protein